MLFRVLVFLFLLLTPVVALAQQTAWEPPYRGDDPTLLYLPDTHATYWRYGWTRKPGDTGGLIISGAMPDARYFSYNVYDDNTKSSMGSLTDFQIVPKDGAPNPFAGEVANGQSNYEILVLPEGTKTDAKNVLFFPDNLTKVSTFLRHYVPNNNINGDVPLPTVALYEPSTKKVSDAPKSDKIPVLSKQEAREYLLPLLKEFVTKLEENPEQVLEKLRSKKTAKPIDMKELVASQVVGHAFKFFRPGKVQLSLRLQTAGTYPNSDNFYLVLPVVRSKDQVLMARFKAPQLPKAMTEFPTADVRYYSLSQGDEYSYTHGTIMDADMKIDSNGFANFMIADNTPEMIAKAEELGANFMAWEAGDKMMLIYRHMLPAKSFAQGIDKVASYTHEKPAPEQFAVKTIGAYALVGQMMDQNEISALSQFPSFK